MSQRIDCPKCGEPMDIPAYPGDGVYTTHTCPTEGYVPGTGPFNATKRKDVQEDL